MPRYPDRESKTIRLVVSPRPGEEVKVRAFKELISRNDLRISDILFEKVEEFLKEHNWPPGNSQTIITSFAENEEPGEPQPHVYEAQLKIQERNKILVSEKELHQVCEQWEHISESGKQSWIRILKQIDHPIAHEILEKNRCNQ